MIDFKKTFFEMRFKFRENFNEGPKQAINFSEEPKLSEIKFMLEMTEKALV